MARRVIQFPVRNAFAPQRSHDSLARDTAASTSATQAQRIVKQVEDELGRKAERLATGRATAFESARSFGVTTMPSPKRSSRLRKGVDSVLGLFRRDQK